MDERPAGLSGDDKKHARQLRLNPGAGPHPSGLWLLPFLKNHSTVGQRRSRVSERSIELKRDEEEEKNEMRGRRGAGD